MKVLRKSGYIFYSVDQEERIRREIVERVNERTMYSRNRFNQKVIKKEWKEEERWNGEIKYTYEITLTSSFNCSKKERYSESYTIIEL